MSEALRQKQEAIDRLVERAVQDLAAGRLFQCEAGCVDAMRRARAAADFERIALAAATLRDVRRKKREGAVAAGRVTIVDGEVPSGRELEGGCYLVRPPRVGADARALREALDEKRVPGLVMTREPRTRDGLWPIVAIGPVTVRTRVTPPETGEDAPPAPEWFVGAAEDLGETAIEELKPGLAAVPLVDALMDRLETVRDHDGLHDRLIAACHAAQAAAK